MAQMPSTLHTLLAETIDYAGLFPPAALDLATTTRNFLDYTNSPHAALLARLIIPASKLQAFVEIAAHLPSPPASHSTLSVLVGADVLADMALVRACSGPFTITALEAKAASVREIDNLAAQLPQGMGVYVELPVNDDIPHLLHALAEKGLRAKIRTGGETADKFPSPRAVAQFIHACKIAGIVFKATAGLHHPIRADYRLTYAPDSPHGTMHGFLNVFIAACFAWHGWDVPQLTDILSETDVSAFTFDDKKITWRGHNLSLADIHAARQNLIASFGSCSFTEPVDDLRALHLMD